MTLPDKSPRTRFLTSVLLIVVFSASAAQADVNFDVNTTADLLDQDTGDGLCVTASGQCSLRAAIMQANHLTGPIATHIRLPAGNYVLTRPASGSNGEDSGDLNFTAPLSSEQIVFIDGTSAANSILDANQSDRVLSIALGRKVVLSRVTLRNGSPGGVGGGIYSLGNLSVIDSVIEANTTNFDGGAIYSIGMLDIQRSTLRNNVGNIGGAISADAATVTESSLYGNVSMFDGGAIFSGSPDPANKFVVIINSTISGNSARRNGGGIASYGPTYVYSSSIINNDANHNRNMPGGAGGGVWVSSGERFIATNTLIAGNIVQSAPLADDCKGVLEVYGRNLLGTLDGCTFTGNGTAARGLISTNTIGPLQDNGGPTWTHALLAGSEAIDATTAQGCIDDTLALLATDQRGAARSAGLRCDVGAYEYGSVVETIFKNGFD